MKAKNILLRQMGVVKWFLPFFLLISLSLSAYGQQRRPCVWTTRGDGTRTRSALDIPSFEWDPQHIYRQAVVLITFADFDFKKEDPKAFYQQILNEPGYNEGYGVGCAADYFRDQSGGRFNLQFDVYGPIKVSVNAQKGANYYGEDAIREAMQKLPDIASGVDFSVYDWDGNGEVDQMLFIAAGFTGNHKSGYLWPNSNYAYFKAPGDVPVRFYSISCEMWRDESSCGIGTIIHEFSHCLGLPDLYPYSSDFSVVDEWDLMDGGNYTNKGWCPPNYSAMEKMLLGWGDPIELDADTTITDMKPVSEGGETYIIRNSGYLNEYYILENRRQTNWDYALPGQGLAIFHVDYDEDVWGSNDVNYYPSHLRYALFHADGKDYKTWDPKNDGKDPAKYTMDGWIRNRYLSTSVYPYVDSLTVNESLTDDSDPAATLFNPNVDGVNRMSKPVTNIRMAPDGTISFDFKASTSAIQDIIKLDDQSLKLKAQWYDLNGRRLPSAPSGSGIFILRLSDGTTRKVIQ